MPKEDSISVIVTAYKRKNYLEESLRSLERQTLHKDKFEVILITNFEFNISGYKLNIKAIVMEGTIGEFLQRGILECNNDRICFLDDDDLFHPQKLQILLDNFGAEYTYFKNSYKMFTDSNDSFEEIPSFKADVVYSSNLVKRYSHVYDTNLSSISIRKSVVNGFINILPGIKTCQDNFFYLCFIRQKGKGLIAKEALSYYRIHESTSMASKTRNSPIFEKHVEWTRLLVTSYEMFYSIFGDDKDIGVFLNSQIIYSRIYLYTLTLDKVDRPNLNLIKFLLHYALFFDTRILLPKVNFILYGILPYILPKIGNLLYLHLPNH
jgi:glycosyltransferase involved in cell wall biosynthesis